MLFSRLNENLSEHEVGAKAFNLSKLIQAGIPVPNGYVISKKFYQNKLAIEQDSESFKQEILRVSQSLKSPFIMVRSSAIGEDSVDHSFAGQLDSFISKNEPEAILRFIFKCWDSLDNSRSQLYGNSIGARLSSMGVIIQEMIEPDFAGVLFTHSPTNYEESHLEWVSGHAEKLVAGEVNPEVRFFSSPICVENVPFNFLKLHELSGQIFKLYGRPQDIEWAAKSDAIYIVQSRPITTIKHKLNWSNTNVNENYPDKLAPFLDSLARRSYYHYFKNLALQFNVYPKDTQQVEAAFSNIIGTWGHRMYYNMSNIHTVFALAPFENLFKKSFDDFVGYQKKSSPSKKLSSFYLKGTFALNLIKHCALLEGRVKSIESQVDAFFVSCEKASNQKEFSQNFHEFLHLRFNEWNKASFADMFAMVTHGILGKICKMIDEKRGEGIQNELLQAIPNLISNRPIFEMYRMHLEIEKMIENKELFKKSPELIWQELELKKNDLYQVISDYLRHWGFRCSGELTFMTDNYCDRPEHFIEMLKMYHASAPENPELQFSQKRIEQRELLKQTIKLSKKTPGKLKFILPLVLKPLVQLTSYSISCRERVRLKQAKLYYGAKKTLLSFSQVLIKKNILSGPHDIFFLEYTEVSRLFSGEEIDKDYFHQLIKLRRLTFEKAQQKKDNFYSYLGDFTNDTISMDNGPASGLKGLSACGGEVTGVVKILESMHDIGRLEKGDILVTRQTDPGWICAFPLISGLIVERGGMLSHGAIVAREFGIPAVVGVENITTTLKDGQKIHLNAYTGVITCLD